VSIQAFATQAFDGQLVDPKTGNLTLLGTKFLLALHNRTGQGTGIIPAVSDDLTATGTTLADALGLTADWNLVVTTPANSGVRILALKPGNDIAVWNVGANTLKVYPPDANTQIDIQALGTPFVLAAGKLRIFECWTVPPRPARFASFGN